MSSRATAVARRIYRCSGMKWNEAPFPIHEEEGKVVRGLINSIFLQKSAELM